MFLLLSMFSSDVFDVTPGTIPRKQAAGQLKLLNSSRNVVCAVPILKLVKIMMMKRINTFMPLPRLRLLFSDLSRE